MIVDKVYTQDKTMQTVIERAAYYRANPHRFVKDYLGIDLRLFQMILIVMMNFNTNFMYLASRGQGKTFLCAIFCCVRCILYPGTRICIASSKRAQACEVLEKIMTIFYPNSANLRNEIEVYKNNNTENYIKFHNTSMIKVVTASDSARSNRANILIIDEFRMVDQTIIATVLKKFLTAEREPGFLNKDKYKKLRNTDIAQYNKYKERNKEMYLSSAYYKKHWSWEKTKTYCAAMLDDKRSYFLCGLPYQLSIKEGILNAEQVADEMSEADFSQIIWDMESGCLWHGESDDALFSYSSLIDARAIKTAFYPHSVTDYYPALKNPTKKNGEIRVLAVDIAVMASKKNKNDATAIHILQLLPTSNSQYIRNLVYSENFEGGHSETQAITIRRLCEDLECDYIVIDTNGVGNGVYDELVKDLVDPVTGELYPAFTCMNDEAMAEKYKGSSRNPRKVIYSIKASAKFNSDCAYLLKDNLMRGKTRLLINEKDADDILKQSKTFRGLDEEIKANILMPYIQTALLVNELVNLKYETNGSLIKIMERGNERKDRYSALAYGNYFATELERTIVKHKKAKLNDNFIFEFRAPSLRTS